MSSVTQIFLCYSREDVMKVEEIYLYLFDRGYRPWMDKKNILPGEPWEKCLEEAIKDSDFFIACLSNNSVNKRGVIQKEIKKALEIWELKLPQDIYLIPIRLDVCETPLELRKFQWVNLYEKDCLDLLSAAIAAGMQRRGKTLQPTETSKTNVLFTKTLTLFEQYKFNQYVSTINNKLTMNYGWNSERANAAAIVLAELVNNAFEHGCNGRGELEVAFEACVESEGKHVVVRVKSPREGFELQKALNKVKKQDTLAPRGRGLLLVEQLSDKLISSSDGTIIQSIISRDNYPTRKTDNTFDSDIFTGECIDVNDKRFWHLTCKEERLRPSKFI